MHGSLSGEEIAATNGAAGSSPDNPRASDRGNILPQHDFALFANDVWTVKAPAAVEQYTGRPSRTCRSWCADIEAPSSAVFAILRDKEGYRYLKRVMRDDPPEWWANFQLALQALESMK